MSWCREERRGGAPSEADVGCPAVNSAGRKFVLIEEVDHGSNDVGSRDQNLHNRTEGADLATRRHPARLLECPRHGLTIAAD